MTRFVLGALVALLIGLPISLSLHAEPPATVDEKSDKPSAEQASVWMEKKMEYAQQIMRGLASGDFDQIGTNTRQMRLLSKVEGFVRGSKPGYRTHLNTFERVCDDMIRQADQENLAGVTLAFNQMTVSCVNCHHLLRTEDDGASSEKTIQPVE